MSTARDTASGRVVKELAAVTMNWRDAAARLLRSVHPPRGGLVHARFDAPPFLLPLAEISSAFDRGTEILEPSRQRITSIERAHAEGVPLPPILVGFAACEQPDGVWRGCWWLFDGNHRVYCARRRGLRMILAKATTNGEEAYARQCALGKVRYPPRCQPLRADTMAELVKRSQGEGAEAEFYDVMARAIPGPGSGAARKSA